MLARTNLVREIVSAIEESERSTGRSVPVGALAREQTRARYPDEDGYVESAGVRVFHEVYGAGEPSVLLLPGDRPLEGVEVPDSVLGSSRPGAYI
jgi:hypothetical protein